MSIRSGARLGIDVGTVRIGIARSDLHGMLAIPLQTVKRGDAAISDILTIIKDTEAIEVIIGLPLALNGSRTASTQDALDFAAQLAGETEVPVRLVDERLSTISAQQVLHSSGRNTRSSRQVIDQVAATIILQHALDIERSSGNLPGELVAQDKG